MDLRAAPSPTRPGTGRPGARHGGDRLALVGGGLVAAVLLLLWIDATRLSTTSTGDTGNLIRGARFAVGCLRDLEVVGCGVIEGTPATRVFPYPLLQYVPAMVLAGVGATQDTIYQMLVRLNVAALAATFALSGWVFRRRPGCAALAVAGLLASSAMYHGAVGFGEMLAAAGVLAAVAFAIERRAAPMVVACIAATTAKETLAPFVLVFVVLAARDDDDGWLPERKMLLASVAGVATGVVLSLAFNVFRFGSPRNVSYLDPLFRTPGLGRKLEFLAGGWLSPSAGIAVHWPVTTMVVAACGTVAATRLARRGGDLRAWLPSAVLVATLVGFTAGLAAWLSPFGWIAYGPRLAVPVLPAATVLALHLNRTTVEAFVDRLGYTRLGLGVAAAAITIVGWPQFGVAWSRGAAVGDLIAPSDTCPPMTETPLQRDAALYYRCTSEVMWRTSSLPIDEAATEGGRVAHAARVLSAGACTALLSRNRRGTEP